MQAYTCKNKKCFKYLIGGVALCKVTSNGIDASLDVNDGVYLSEDGTCVTGEAHCFHCKRLASKIEFQPDNDKPEQVCQMIDELDAEIESILKSLGAQ